MPLNTPRELTGPQALDMTAKIIASYVSNNQISPDELLSLIKSVHKAVGEIALRQSPGLPQAKPAVPVSKSITDEFIICLEDGRKLKMLKRYLRSRYDLSPEEYRERWNLPKDYPMVAPDYARRRSDFAKEIGLGKSKKGSSIE